MVPEKGGPGSAFTFSLSLPLASKYPPTSETETSIPETAMATFSGAHILVAEDNPTNQQVLLAFLQRLDVHAECVPDGHAALQALNEKTYDLVLMDLQMPNVDGLSATRLWREKESSTNQYVPIIALTAHAMQGDRETCLSAGMDDYLSKPIDPAGLKQILQRWLAGKSTPSPQGATQAATEPPLVWNRDSFGERMMGDAELMKSVMATFLADTPTHVQAILDAAEKQDAETLIREAHYLKGAAATVGAEVMGNLVKEIEAAGRAGDWPTLRKEAKKMFPILNQLKEIQQNPEEQNP